MIRVLGLGRYAVGMALALVGLLLSTVAKGLILSAAWFADVDLSEVGGNE